MRCSSISLSVCVCMCLFDKIWTPQCFRCGGVTLHVTDYRLSVRCVAGILMRENKFLSTDQCGIWPSALSLCLHTEPCPGWRGRKWQSRPNTLLTPGWEKHCKLFHILYKVFLGRSASTASYTFWGVLLYTNRLKTRPQFSLVSKKKKSNKKCSIFLVISRSPFRRVATKDVRY